MASGALLIAVAFMVLTTPGAPTTAAPLELEAKIPLGMVSGRIDHLAVDLKRRRLTIAEFGDGALGVVDLAKGKIQSTMLGFKQPQGIAYEPLTDTFYVASAGDGSVRILRAEDLTSMGRIEIGDDADNVRVDGSTGRVLVGYGRGAIGIIDPRSRAKVAEVRLNAHPEGFQIDEGSSRAFVNAPDAQQIAVVDLLKSETVATWSIRDHRENFPMALDREAHRVLVGFRNPARLSVMNSTDGSPVADVDMCRDADDLFVDAKRQRVYVSCGEGLIDVFEDQAGTYKRIAQIPTASGARTSLFVREMDRLFVAVPAAGKEQAAIWAFYPVP